jgi:hypothetical protein
MRKRRTRSKDRGRPRSCVVVVVNGVRRKVCFDKKGRIRTNKRA